MRNKKAYQRKQLENSTGELNNVEKSLPDDNQNQEHNTKKTALGPNTNR